MLLIINIGSSGDYKEGHEYHEGHRRLDHVLPAGHVCLCKQFKQSESL